MRIRLAPSAVGASDAGRGTFLSSYIINEIAAVDAGGLGLLADLDAQMRVKDLLITHSHIDHIASLPIFLETVFQSSDRCVTIHASEAVVAALQTDIFNNRVWPDFITMSKKGPAFVEIKVIKPLEEVRIGGLSFLPIPVDHVVPTLGFLVSEPDCTIAIPSDTGPTHDFWSRAGRTANLKAVFLEASFPNEMAELALASKHLTPALFAAEARKLGRDVPFIAVHIKCKFYDRVVEQLLRLSEQGIDTRIGEPGAIYEF